MNADITRDLEIERYGVVGLPQPELDDLAQVAAQLCHTPVAAINLMQSGTQATIAAVGLPTGTGRRDDSLCNDILDEGRPVRVADTTLDARWADNPFVNGERASFRFYAAHQLVTPRGVVIGTLCVFDDVPRELTDRENDALQRVARRVVDLLELRLRTRELEETVAELTRARNELQRSNEAFGLFAGQVAHDLRGPMTAVNISLGMLRDELGGDEEHAWLLGRALGSIARMDQLIGGMLSFASVGGRPEEVDVDLASVVELLRQDLAADLEGVDLVADDLPVVRGDLTHCRIILQNLVSNAVKFTRGRPGPRVVVTAGVDSTGWHLEVADNGPGVPSEERAQMFELLTQGDRSRGGYGLGLATCMRLVASQGGSIWMDEAPGGGALVRIAVPSRKPVLRNDARSVPV